MAATIAAAAAALLSPSAAATLLSGAVHHERHFVRPPLVTTLRQTLSELGAAGRFVAASSFSSDGSQDELRSALTCKPDINDDRFYALYEQLDELRQQLDPVWDRHGLGRLATGIEATWVVYPKGGYYRRHVDALAGVDPRGSGRRRISFVCYLSDGAWAASDGGSLRWYSDEHGTQDCLPESGSLVIFDSTRVSHEVMPTRRERACLVGWFLAAET